MAKKEKKELAKEVRYSGYFLIDSGIKIPFNISESDGYEEFADLYNNNSFSFKKGDYIWFGEDSDLKLLVDRIIGWEINEYEVS